MDEARITRIAPAGDPFAAAPDERAHVCNSGWVSVGQMVTDPETGAEVEEFAQYLCQRCAEERERSEAGARA